MNNRKHDSRPPGTEPPASPHAMEQFSVRGPGELIAYLPYAIGYHPTPEDIVFVALVGNRLHGSAVMTVTDLDVDDTPRALWTDVTRQLFAGGTTDPADPADMADLSRQVFLVSYGSSRADAFALAIAAAVAEVNEAETGQPDLLDALSVKDRRWSSLMWPGSAGDGPGGEPVPASSPASASAVLAGVSPRASRRELDDVLSPGPGHLVDAVAERLPDWPTDLPIEAWRLSTVINRQEGLTTLDTAHAQGHAEGDTEGDAEGEAEVTARRHFDESVARSVAMLLALEYVSVRDVCLAWTDERAGVLWRDLIRCAPPGWRAPVATLLGAHAFINHDPALARTAFRQAVRDRPGYSLAHTMLEVMANGITADQFNDVVQQVAADGGNHAIG